MKLSFANLRTVLANLYSDDSSIRRLVADAGLAASRLRLNASAEDNWHDILTEAERIGRIDALLDVVMGEYSSNQDFRNACDSYHRNHNSAPRLGVPSKKDKPPLGNRRPGYLLPYMVDRSEQEVVLIEALQQLNRRSDVPYIFLIHGDHLQCHDPYLERLWYEFLPGRLGLDRERQPIQKYHLRWPDFVHISDLYKKLEQNLALCSPPLSPEQINGILAITPVMICTHLCAEDWSHTQDAILGFLRFWQNWPRLTSSQPLLVFMCIEYPIELQIKQERTGFQQLMAKFRNKNVHVKGDVNLLHEKITQLLDNINPSDFHPLVYRALPRLSGIKRGEVHEWARSELTSDFCRGHELFAEIREMFREWEAQHFSQTMPMENLVNFLKEILDRYSST